MASSALPTDRLDLAHEKRRKVKVIGAPTFAPLGLFRQLSNLWSYRDLLYTLSVHRVRVRYKQSLLGATWAVLQPLILMAIYWLLFSVITKVPDVNMPYAVFTFAALLPWTYFSNALTAATGGLVTNSQLVTKVYFPREILPLTYVFASIFDLVVSSFVLAALMIFYRVPVTFNLLYAFPIILILTSFVTAVALVFSATQVRFRDVGVAMPLMLQVWMFATPVVYPLSAVPARFQPFYILNPMVGIVENFRRVILLGTGPDFYTLGISVLFAALLLPAAYLYFKHAEATVADII